MTEEELPNSNPSELPPEPSPELEPVELVEQADAPSPAPSPAPESKPADPPSKMNWYVVKVQSGREDSIKAAIERRVKIENLEEHFGKIVIPVEKVIENRNGRKVVKKKKKFPGYLMCEVEFNDKILYLFRETSGVGDFVGGKMNKPPAPMSSIDVQKMLDGQDDVGGKEGSSAGAKEAPVPQKFHIPYAVGDRVKVLQGTFKDMEGEVKEIIESRDGKDAPKIKVSVTIWGRPVDVEVEYWHVSEL